jgi:hypothetical protein
MSYDYSLWVLRHCYRNFSADDISGYYIHNYINISEELKLSSS